MASAMLRGSKFLWWITPPAIGLSYHFSTIKAADNPNNKVDPKHLEIYDKTDERQTIAKPNDDPSTALEEHISKGRMFVWKHSDTAKNATDSTSKGFKKLVENTKEFSRNIQTESSLQLKAGAIAVAALTGILLAGKGRRPLRRVFYAGGLGTAAAAVCFPNRATSTAKAAYHKLSSLFQDYKNDRDRVRYEERPPDAMRAGETLLLEESIILCDMLVEELIERIDVHEVHLPDFETVCKEIIEEILLGINEDFEIQTGGYVGGKHVAGGDAPAPPYDVLLRAQDITKRAVQEVLDSIDEDMDIQTGGAHSRVPTIGLDSTVLAKDLASRVAKVLEDDLGTTSDVGQRSYLFSDPDDMATVVSDEYVKCVEAAIGAQVKTGRCHVILNSTSLAAKTGAELRVAIEKLKKDRASDLVSARPVKISDSRVVSERVAARLLDFIEHHVKTSRGKDYAYSEAGHIVRKASEGATKAIGDEIQRSGAEAEGRKTRIALDMQRLPKAVVEEITAAVQEDIEIQTGSGFRGPPETRKPKKPREPSPPIKEADAVALEGVMLSPMSVEGFEQLADALVAEVSEGLHGRGVVVTELEHVARAIMREALDAIDEDIEIQTGGWSAREHRAAHVVVSAQELIKKVAREVMAAIEEDMNIQTGGSLEKKRDLFLDSRALSTKIVDAVMEEVDRDLKKQPGASDAPFLFSLPQQLGQLAAKNLDKNIEDAAIAIGLQIRRIHVDVESLADDVGRQLKEGIERNYIRAKAMGELDSDREIALTDLNEIRKKVASTVKVKLIENPLVTPRAGNEPVHVVEEFGRLTKRVVEGMTKAIQEDIEVQTGGARQGRRLNIVIDTASLVKALEEIHDAVEEDIDIQTGRGFRSKPKEEPEEKPAEGTPPGGNPGQSDAEDKDMYSTRSN